MRELLAALGQAMDWELGAWWSPERRAAALPVGLAPRRVGRGVRGRQHAARARARIRAAGARLGERTAGLERRPRSRSELPAGGGGRARRPARLGLRAGARRSRVPRGDRVLQPAGRRAGPRDAPDPRHVAEQIGGFMAVLDQRADLIAKLQRLALTDDADGAGQSPRLAGEPRARARASPTPRRAAVRRDARPRPLQALQRHARPSGRRPAAARARRHVARAAARQRRPRPLRRRGVRARLPRVTAADRGRVLERVRAAVPRQQTCSAGLAEFDGSESAEQLVGRADAALYEAKAQGRDRTVVAPGS